MMEQNKHDEALSNHPAPHTDPHHAINVPDSGSVDSTSGSVDSTSPPIQGYPPSHQDFPTSKVNVGEEKRLGFFGHGFGWDLFILGFFLLAIPWFIGAVIFLLMICFKADQPGKYGFVACFIGAIVISIVLDSFQRGTSASTQSISQGVDFS